MSVTRTTVLFAFPRMIPFGHASRVPHVHPKRSIGSSGPADLPEFEGNRGIPSIGKLTGPDTLPYALSSTR